jgi:hypothetical protein
MTYEEQQDISTSGTGPGVAAYGWERILRNYRSGVDDEKPAWAGIIACLLWG